MKVTPQDVLENGQVRLVFESENTKEKRQIEELIQGKWDKITFQSISHWWGLERNKKNA